MSGKYTGIQVRFKDVSPKNGILGEFANSYILMRKVVNYDHTPNHCSGLDGEVLSGNLFGLSCSSTL